MSIFIMEGGYVNEVSTYRGIGIKENLLKPRTYLGFAVAAAVIYIFFRNFDFSTALASIADAKVSFLLLAVAVFYVSLPLRAPAGDHSCDHPGLILTQDRFRIIIFSRGSPMRCCRRGSATSPRLPAQEKQECARFPVAWSAFL